MTTYKLLLLPGDGIGTEIMAEVKTVIDWFGKRGVASFESEQDLAGGAAYDTHGKAISEAITDVTGPPGKKFTFEQLPEAAKALENGEDIDYEGVSGPIDWDDNGDLSRYIYDISEFKGGKLVKLDTVEVSAEE